MAERTMSMYASSADYWKARAEAAEALNRTLLEDWKAAQAETTAEVTKRELAELRAEAAEAKLAEVEKDAERWRWLRTNRTTALEATALHAYQSDAHMEAAIDAAMQGADK